MNKIPSEHHSVDLAGFMQQTQAVRCVLETRSTTIEQTPQENRDPVPSDSSGRPATAVKRSLILIQNRAAGAEPAFISGDGVNNTEGYRLVAGESIALPVSPSVRIFAVKGTSVGTNPDLRTLEIG